MSAQYEDPQRVYDFTRPNDSTAYLINDRLGPTTADSGTTPLVAMNFGVGQSQLWIAYARIETDVLTFLPPIKVHLFGVPAPVTAIVGDNTPFARVWANRAQRIGGFTFPALQLERAADTVVHATRDDLRIKLAFPDSNSRCLYPVFEVGAAATPGALQNFTFTMRLVSH